MAPVIGNCETGLFHISVPACPNATRLQNTKIVITTGTFKFCMCTVFEDKIIMDFRNSLVCKSIYFSYINQISC